MIIAAVMATGVTPLHQEMKAGKRDEGEIAHRPPQLEQGHPPAELNNCSETHQDTQKSKPTQEEKVIETRESVIEPVVQVSNWAKGEREEGSLMDQLKRLTGITSLAHIPGFGILLAILCVLWGQVWYWWSIFSNCFFF